MLGTRRSSFTHVLLLQDPPHRPKYEQKWRRRQEAGDERARRRLLKNRIFIPLALGKVTGRIEGRPFEAPAMNGISIPLEDEIDMENYFSLVAAMGRAFTRQAQRIRETPEHLRKRAFDYRTIRIESGMTIQAHTFVLMDEITSLLATVADISYAAGAYPTNFRAEQIVAAGTLQGDQKILQDLMNFLKASCNVMDSTVAEITDEDEDDEELALEEEEIPDEMSDDDDDLTEEDFDGSRISGEGGFSYPEDFGSSKEGRLADETDADHDANIGEEIARPEAADWTSAPPAHALSGAGPVKTTHTTGDGKADVRHDVRNAPRAATDDAQDERVPPPPFRAQLLETEDEEEAEEPSGKSLDIHLPAPEVITAHLISSPLAYFTRWPIFLMFPLLTRHPALVLVGLEMILSWVLWELITGNRLRDPYLIVFLYVLSFGMGVTGVLLAYRIAGYVLSLADGFTVLIRWTGRLVQAITRVFTPPAPASGGSGGVQPGTGVGGPIATVHISRPRGGDGRGEHHQAVDILTAVALLTALHPDAQFLTPVLLGIALSVEAGHPNPLTPAVAVGYLAWMIARDPVHHVIGLLLMLVGVPMVRGVLSSAYRDEVSRISAISGLIRDAIRLIRTPSAIRIRLIALLRGGDAVPARWRMPANPARAALDHPVLMPLSRALEDTLQVRQLIERYVRAIERREKSSKVSRKERASLRAERAFWEEVRRQPLLIGLLPKPDGGIWRVGLRPVYFPPIADLPVGAPSYGHRGLRRGDDVETIRELFEGNGWLRYVGEALESRELRHVKSSGKLMFEKDRGIYLTNIGVITPERIAEWKDLARAGMVPEPVPTEKGVFVPFAISTMLGGDPAIYGHRWFGIHFSPHANAHTLIVQDTRGGKTATMLAMILGVLRAYGNPSMLWPVGIVAIDGKADLATALEGVAGHPAIFAPPHRFEIDRPYRTLYYLSATFGALKARMAFQNFLVRTAAEMSRQAPDEWRDLVRLSGGRLDNLSRAVTAMDTIHLVIPGAGMLWILVDEMWGLINNLRDRLGVIDVRVGEGKDDRIRVRADRLVESAILQLVVMGASAGLVLLFASQSARREATDHAAVRDNTNLFRGSNVSPAVVQPLLSESMKGQQAMMSQVYQVRTGQGNIPQYAWEVFLRGPGYGTLAFVDGRPDILFGRSGRGGESYEVDCVYSPEVRPDLLPATAESIMIPEWSGTVLSRMARFARDRNLFQEFPSILIPLAENRPDGLSRLLREMIAVKITEDEVIRMGQAAIAGLAMTLQGEQIVAGDVISKET